MPWSPEAYHRFEKQNIIADLESQKVSLEEQSDNLSYFKSFDKKTDTRIQEVEKKYKHDHVYLDVEGKDANGNEIEFDMLQDGERWQIVEVQRDMTLEDLPFAVKTLIKKQENSDQVRRIIESKQYGTDITIYEFYLVAENGTESRKEIKSENDEVVLLDEEWKH